MRDKCYSSYCLLKLVFPPHTRGTTSTSTTTSTRQAAAGCNETCLFGLRLSYIRQGQTLKCFEEAFLSISPPQKNNDEKPVLPQEVPGSTILTWMGSLTEELHPTNHCNQPLYRLIFPFISIQFFRCILTAVRPRGIFVLIYFVSVIFWDGMKGMLFSSEGLLLPQHARKLTKKSKSNQDEHSHEWRSNDIGYTVPQSRTSPPPLSASKVFGQKTVLPPFICSTSLPAHWVQNWVAFQLQLLPF